MEDDYDSEMLPHVYPTLIRSWYSLTDICEIYNV
jgi:hypothetical protein